MHTASTVCVTLRLSGIDFLPIVHILFEANNRHFVSATQLRPLNQSKRISVVWLRRIACSWPFIFHSQLQKICNVLWKLKYPLWLRMVSMVIIFRILLLACVKTGSIDTHWISLTHLVNHLEHVYVPSLHSLKLHIPLHWYWYLPWFHFNPSMDK